MKNNLLRQILKMSKFVLDLVFQQVIDQLGVFHHGADSLKAGTVITLTGDGQPVHYHLLDLVALDLLDKIGITDLFRGALHVEVVENRQQDSGYNQPKQ